MPDLPPARTLLTTAPATTFDRVVLTLDDRLIRRKRLTTVHDEGFLVDLPAVTNLDDFWGFELTDGHIHDPATLTDWITAILTHGSARIDAILLAHARTQDDLADLAYAYATSAERWTEMREQGAAFGQTVATLTGKPHPPLPYALALGHAARSLTLPTAEILALFLHAAAAQLISAAVRFVPLGAAEGQRVLADLAPLIADLAAIYAGEPLSALTTSTQGADLAAMRHEVLPIRIYRS